MKKSTFIAALLYASFMNAQTQVIGSHDYGRIFGLTYSTTKQNTVYAETLGNHLVVSNDNGNTWDVFYSLPPEMGESISKLELSKDGTHLSFASIVNRVGVVHILDLETKTITKTYTLPNVSDNPNVGSYDFYGTNLDNFLVISNFSFGIGVASKVFLTEDGGTTWKQIYYSVDNLNIIPQSVVFNPADNQKIYIANGNGSTNVDGGLLLSTDGGTTFTEKITGTVFSKLAFNPSNADDVYLGTGSGPNTTIENLYHSSDGGMNWTIKDINWSTTGITDNIIDIKFNPNDNNHIIVLEEDETVTSRDGGLTWTNKVYPIDNVNSYYYGLKASFNPFKEGEIFISGNYRPLFSTDNANTLAQLKTQFFNSSGLVSLYKNNTAKHLYYSVQYGFVHKNFADNQENGYGIKELNYASNNGVPSYYADIKKEGRVFSFKGGLSGSKLAVSDNFGETFRDIYTVFANTISNIIPDPQVDNVVLAGLNSGNKGDLYRINFGVTPAATVKIATPTNAFVYKVLHPNNLSSEFFLLKGSELYKTINSGTTWSSVALDIQLPSGAAVYDIVQDSLNPDNIALGTSYGVFLSTNRGVSWTRSSTFSATKVFYSDINPGVLIATTFTSNNTSFNIHYSTNSGNTWTTVDRADLLHMKAYSATVEFSDNNVYLYIGSSDLGVVGYELNFNILGNSDVHSEKAKVTVYPNPTENMLYIDSKNLKQVSLFEASGKKLLESTKTEIDLSKFPKGIYILKIINSDNSIISKKIIKK